MGQPDFEEYAEQVLQIVEQIPRGRVTTYGLIAEVLQEVLGRGGPRTVAGVMASYGASVTWWRVVRADGSLPETLAVEARQEYLGEGTPLRPSGSVDLAKAVWLPPVRLPDIHSPDHESVDNQALSVDRDAVSVEDTPRGENFQK